MAVEETSELSEQNLVLKEQQKSVLRKFRRLAPICDSVRDNFHNQKPKNDDTNLQITANTNGIFGQGHAFMKSEPLQYKYRNRLNQCKINQQFQTQNVDLSAVFDENKEITISQHFARPATQASNRSSNVHQQLRRKQSSAFSRIQSSTRRMKSPHMKSKIAASVSKYLVQREGGDGSHDHIEYFFHSMPDLSPGATKKNTTVSSVLQHTKNSHQTAQHEMPKNMHQDSTNEQDGILSGSTTSTRVFLRRPVATGIRRSVLPKFEFHNYRPSPKASAHYGYQAYADKFPSTVRSMKVIPDDMKETPVAAIMKLPSVNGQQLIH